MKTKHLAIGGLLVAIIAAFFSYKYFGESNTTDDRIIAQEENDEMLQFVRTFLNDSTIQIVDSEKGILRKDSICFFYDTKWDTYLVIPDSFELNIAEDNSSMNLTTENEIIKTWAAPHNEEIWNGKESLKNGLIEAGFTIDVNEKTDSVLEISGSAKNEDDSFYSYLKVIALPDSTDLFITYRALSEYKQDEIIRNVIKQFPDKPYWMANGMESYLLY